MKVFVSCVAQKHGDIVANISEINKTNIDSTFNEWESIFVLLISEILATISPCF